eukprot:894249-Amphidinium_carterae.1
MAQHGSERALAEVDILARPTLYHVGAVYLCGGVEPVPPRVPIDKHPEVASDLSSFLSIVLEKSALSKMRALGPGDDSTTFATAIKGARKTVAVSAPSNQLTDCMLKSQADGSAALTLVAGLARVDRVYANRMKELMVTVATSDANVVTGVQMIDDGLNQIRTESAA